MFAALLITASLALPTTSTGHGQRLERPAASARHEMKLAQSRPPDADPNSPDHDPSFVEQYLTYQLAPTALPQVKDGLVMGHVIGYLLGWTCGSLWGPIVAVDGAEFSGDVALTWFLSSILWALISSAATFTGVGALVWFAYPYLSSTATFNAIDRQMKAKGHTPDPNGKTTPPNTTTSPPTNTDTPPPSYAY